MTRLLAGALKLLVKLWPLWLFFLARWLGELLWVSATGGATSTLGLKLAQRGLAAARTLGPVLPLAAAVASRQPDRRRAQWWRRRQRHGRRGL